MHRIADGLSGLILVGGLLVLTRPGSQGSNFVRALGGSAIGLFATATGSTPPGFTPAPTRR